LTAIEFYQQQLRQLEEATGLHEKRIGILQLARGVTAIPGLLFLGFGIFSSAAPAGTWQLGAVLMVAFLAIATWQEQLRWRLDWHRQRQSFFRRLVARCQRHWGELPALKSESVTAEFRSDLGDDLDLFGDRSLYRWLSLAATESGAKELATWLTRRQDKEVLSERQQAVRYLAHERGWRSRFWDASHAFRASDTRLESIQKWSDSPYFFQRYPWLRLLAWATPALVLVLSFVLISALNSDRLELAGYAFVGLLITIAVNLVATVGFIGGIHDIFVWIGGANRELQSFSDLMSCVEQLGAPETLLARLNHQMQTRNGSATQALRILRFRMRFAGLQRNPLFFLPYILLQIFFLWDMQILTWLESWRKAYGHELSRWIDAVGQLESLTSAATVADEQPDWCYPSWTTQAGRGLAIEQLAHPLLPEKARVANDLTMVDERPLLLVTGSNMAGKSTLLRSLGVNIALSWTGAPVASRTWTAPNFDLASSIRVKDSLQDGVSFFMAELKRLKSVVDWAHERQAERGIPTLILLDEILQGTNSRERQIAVQSVLEHLTQLGCTVAASTHDLDLAKIPFVERTAQVVHFREFFETVEGREVMRFDYKMREGVTPTTNALKLLELVGLQKIQRTQ
jgi:predicted ATPase